MFLVLCLILLAFLFYCRQSFTGSSSLVDPSGLKVQVINLDRRVDRLAELRKRYENSDMRAVSLERVPAVDGRNTPLDSVPITYSAKLDVQRASGPNGFRTAHPQLTPGAIGCYLSHIKAYEALIKDDNAEYSLILEDDAKIPRNLGAHIQSLSSKVPGNWDILLLGHLCKHTSVLYPTKQYRKVKRFFLMHCYVIKKSAATKILQSPILPMKTQIDWYISDLCSNGKLQVYATPVPVCKQTARDTDIQIKLIKNTEPR